MARRPRPTLADYAVIGISPALIMFLIGSLVFFLITIFYQGQFDVRLSFIMAMFIMAAVSIARISIEQGREYASVFALPLAGVTLFAMFRFVEFSGAFARFSFFLNIGLIAMIWFCADKLTWDCTVIDENEDQSGQGLLQTAGLDDGQTAGATGATAEAASDDPDEVPPPVATGLWQRFVEHRRRPHAPGIWVIYFSVAALPIFGFGQLFLRDDISRRYAFKLLVVYVGSALGLLLTTSFLGLRRYLRQRRLEMPIEMAGTWLGVGAAMIVALLLICMLMPRRNAEYSVSDLSFLNSPIDLPVSDWGVGNDGPEQEEAERQVTRDDADAKTEGQQGEGGQTETKQSQQKGSQHGKSSSGGQKSGKGSGKESAKQSQRQQDGTGKQPDGRSQDKSNQQGKSNQRSKSKQQDSQNRNGQSQGDRGDQKGQDPNAPSDPSEDAQEPADSARQQKSTNQAQNRDSQKKKSQQQESQSESKKSKGQQSKSQQSKDSRANQAKSKQGQTSPSNRQPNPPQPFNLSTSLSGILKALYWLIAIAVIGYLVWKHWEQVRDAVRKFIKAMQDLWSRLFGGTPRDVAEETVESIEPSPTWKLFSDFADPFVTGRADQTSTAELISYTFEAFEAWGRENGCGRLAEQTPIEFARAAIRSQRRLSKEALRVAELYNWTAFGKTAVPEANREYLRRFWKELSASPVT